MWPEEKTLPGRFKSLRATQLFPNPAITHVSTHNFDIEVTQFNSASHLKV